MFVYVLTGCNPVVLFIKYDHWCHFFSVIVINLSVLYFDLVTDAGILFCVVWWVIDTRIVYMYSEQWLFYAYEQQMDLCSQSSWQLSVCPSCSVVSWARHYLQTFHTNSSIPAMIKGIIDLYLYHFQCPWPRLKVTRSAESKTGKANFHPLFSTYDVKIWSGVETIQTEPPNLTVEWDLYCYPK